MRLIDADALKQEMLAAGVERNEPVKANALCSIINSQPTVPTCEYWIPANQPPKTNSDGMSERILLLYDDYPIPLAGLYKLNEREKGHYYVYTHDMQLIFILDTFVIAWAPLPKFDKEGKKK